MPKTPLEQYEETLMNGAHRMAFETPDGWEHTDCVTVEYALEAFTAAARQLVLSELEGLKKEQYGDIPIWIAQSEINKVIKRYKPSLLELPESEQQAIYEKTAKESTKLQQDLIKQYNGGGDETQ